MSLARPSLGRRQGSCCRLVLVLAGQQRRLLGVSAPVASSSAAASTGSSLEESVATIGKSDNQTSSRLPPAQAFYGPGQAPPNLRAKFELEAPCPEATAQESHFLKTRPIKAPMSFIGTSRAPGAPAEAKPVPVALVEQGRRSAEIRQQLARARGRPSRSQLRMTELQQQDQMLRDARASVESDQKPRPPRPQMTASSPESELARERLRDKALRRLIKETDATAHFDLALSSVRGRADPFEPNVPQARRHEDRAPKPRDSPAARPKGAADRLNAWGETGDSSTPMDRMEASRRRIAQLKKEADAAAMERSQKDSAAQQSSVGFAFNTDSFDASPPVERSTPPAKQAHPPTWAEVHEERTDYTREQRRRPDPKPAGPILTPAGSRQDNELFLGLGVRQETVDAMKVHFPHIRRPTKFQRQLMANIALGHDIIAQQSTGQGKTLSTLLALLSLETRRVKVPGNHQRQSTALFVVSSLALVQQVMKWAALLVRPEDLARTIGTFDPSAPMSSVDDDQAPIILLTTPDALRLEHIVPMRAVCLRTIVLDEADSIIWPTRADSKVNGDLVVAVENMLHSGFVHSPEKALSRRKPQIITLGSTITPALMTWLRTTREWVSPSVRVITRGKAAGAAETTGTLVMPKGEMPTSSTYSSHSLALQAHHVVIVAPSGRFRNLASPAPLASDLEPLPAPAVDSDGRLLSFLPASIFDTFVTLYRSALAANPAEQILLVLKDQVAVADAQRRLAEQGIVAQPVPVTVDPSASGKSQSPAETKDQAALRITDVASSRGLDIPSLTTVYTTADAISGAADYVHVAGRLARLGSATSEGRGKVITLVPGDTQEAADEKDARLEAMAAWIKKRKADRASRALSPDEEALTIADKFAPVNYALEKVKFALATLKAEAEDLPSIP